MKKILIDALVMVTVIVFSCTLVLAGSNCPLSKKAAKCPITSKICAVEKPAEAGTAAHPEKCSHLSLAVEKINDAESEAEVRRNLENGEGVICLMSVDQKDGKVIVCYDSEKTDADKLVKLVADAGFDAKVVPTDKKDIRCTGDAEKCKKICGFKGEKL
ncbi:MAG: hypothetical protein JSU69_03865 [Candidatus Zixiibacteriota bacterium]|nr:MAG: hypothetical protein JSU69_03865 [candidate division Zixibacteria bacterium]